MPTTLIFSIKHHLNSFKYLFLLFTLYSCTQNKNLKEKPVESKLQIAETILTEKKADCNDPYCTTISVKYPRFESLPQFNKIIKETIETTLSEDYVIEASGSESITELEDLFIQSHGEYVKNFPEASTPWSLSLVIQISYTSPEFVSLTMRTDTYTGGAHPNSRVDYINLLKGKSKPLPLNGLIKDTKEFSPLAEKYFRKHHNIADGEPLSRYDFTFEDDEFAIAESVGFNNQGLILYYNNYEIAAYARGSTELIIPWDEVKDFLKIQL